MEKFSCIWPVKATTLLLWILLSVLLLMLLLLHYNIDHRHPLDVKAIYQFGNSFSDTGNFIREPIGSRSGCARLPYGETFFHHPTGRCSDGLVVTDYLAKFFKLPFLDPYLNKDGNFKHGVNFAVAVALDVSTLASKNLSLPPTNSSLSVQLNWFRSHLNSICASPSDCKKKLQNALFLMGEIGGNDVSLALFEMKSMEDRQKLVLEVVQVIKSAGKEVIDLGATRVVVPGNFPIGCMPIYLVGFKTDNLTMYNELNCLKHLNAFAKFQNHRLQRAVKELQHEHPHVAIVYSDSFYALRRILSFAQALGFDEDATLKACCGSGDDAYNFNLSRMCGDGVPLCPNPHTRISWDGIHLTSHAYLHMARSLITEIVSAMSPVEVHPPRMDTNFIFPPFSWLVKELGKQLNNL